MFSLISSKLQVLQIVILMGLMTSGGDLKPVLKSSSMSSNKNVITPNLALKAWKNYADLHFNLIDHDTKWSTQDGEEGEGFNSSTRGSRSNSTPSSRKEKFQPMFSVFLIELILVLLSNLFTLMIRSYKNSIPQVKLNIIIIISYYIVEWGNLVLFYQGCFMMYCSLISHIPLVLAYSVSFILNYSNLVAVGLFIEMALLRVYAVVHFGRFFGYDPDRSSKLVLVFTAILYLPQIVLLQYHQLQSGYISPMESFLTGNQASYTVNKIFIIHVLHMILGIIILFLSYAFINLYLSRKHSVHVTSAEKNNPSKNMFSLKTLMMVGVITLTLTLIIIYYQNKAQPFPIGSVITSFLLTLVNLYFASKPYIVDYFLLLLRRKQTNYEMFLPVVRLPNNQVDVIG